MAVASSYIVLKLVTLLISFVPNSCRKQEMMWIISGAGDTEVEDGNPNVIWSASKDGTLRQHDLREGVLCGANHQDRYNILLDLQSGAKRSLSDMPHHCLSLKTCAISPTRPHHLLVGGR